MGTALSDLEAAPLSPDYAAARRSIPEDAEPVWTYREARGWLWRNVDPRDMEAVIERNAPPPPVMRLIAAIFWVGLEKLRADLRREWRGS